MPSPLDDAMDEARALGGGRGWVAPSDATVAEARRLLGLLAADVRQPQLLVEPDGAITVEWDLPERGWLQLTVRGGGELAHSAVIDGDEYTQVEPLGEVLPDWAAELLRRLHPPCH